MRTICYVILNYKTYEEAAACAESILSTQTWKNMHIVIVDNGSGNGSEEWLVEHFIDEKRVRVTASGENLGFARGNNLGIRYAREHYDPDPVSYTHLLQVRADDSDGGVYPGLLSGYAGDRVNVRGL